MSQWYTDPILADQFVEWAFRDRPPRSVLEPSAGRGSLIVPLLSRFNNVPITAFDLDPENVEEIASWDHKDITVEFEDFLSADIGSFDAAVMNPPYENDADAMFIIKASRHCKRVFAIVRGVFRHGTNRWDLVWRWVDPIREVVLRRRPGFGGDYTPKQDFSLYELRIRKTPRKPREPITCEIEWW